MLEILKAKDMTPEQWHRAHRVVASILTFCYLLFIVVEAINHKEDITGFVVFRIVFYALSTLLLYLNLHVNKTKKMGMIIYALSFIIVYGMVCTYNGIGVTVFAFPIALVFNVYMNSRALLIGFLFATLLAGVKAAFFKGDGDMVSYNVMNTITMAYVAGIYSAVRVSNLLIRFDKENMNKIEEQVEFRDKAAETISGVVSQLDDAFKFILQELDSIKSILSNCNNSIHNITDSSASNAIELDSQSTLTTQVHNRLSSIHSITGIANDTTSNLKGIIDNSDKIVNELNKQSNIVDSNTNNISETVELLVDNVQKVSGITEAILKISSQTNLLALNASIEAARAGDAGKGFAVVADQIRTLAEETKTSTEQITEIINELKTITNSTQEGVSNSAESIDLQRNYVLEVAKSFKSIESGMDVLVDGITTINDEVTEVFNDNKGIVSSSEVMTASSAKTLIEAKECQEVIDEAVCSFDYFVKIVNNAAKELIKLKDLTQS